MHQSFETPPPIRALAMDCGGTFTSYTLHFGSPVGGEVRLKSRSSHPLLGYLLAAQRSICFLHGCHQCFLVGVLRLAIISCFTKGVPCVEN